MDSIAYLEVYLESPDNTPGIYRISSAISYDSKNNEIKDHQELIDNTEFNGSGGSNFREEIKAYVAQKLKVNPDIIIIRN